MRARYGATFIAFAAMIAVAVGYVASLGIRVGPPSHRTNISMEVADINSLVVGSNVLMRGVEVGKVTSIEWAPDGATIGFYIDDGVSVPVDSDVRLENLSSLGESYIRLAPRSPDGPTMHDGQHIATERVIAPASISELSTSIVRVLNQADPDALQRVVNEIDTGLPDPNSVLPNLAHTSLLLRNIAADMNGRGKALLDNFQTLLQNADWLGPLLSRVTPSLHTLGVDGSDLVATVVAGLPIGSPQIQILFNRYFDRIQRLLDKNGGDLKVLGDELLPHLKGIAGSLMNFDTGQMLSNILATLPEDGTVTLHVTIPPK
ncbi:MlaD family protein [Mycolicibacterium septicum]|uniref:MlaD family protein n=1 Tax=Mycolicibacterium septicum TaxID=98668 RepID=UPI002362D947|nr:MlaD family protein [Mycolicibacterium septicum]